MLNVALGRVSFFYFRQVPLANCPSRLAVHQVDVR
jgi:hypothetical protein